MHRHLLTCVCESVQTQKVEELHTTCCWTTCHIGSRVLSGGFENVSVKPSKREQILLVGKGTSGAQLGKYCMFKYAEQSRITCLEMSACNENDTFTLHTNLTIWKKINKSTPRCSGQTHTFTQSQINPLCDWEVSQAGMCLCVWLIFRHEACRNQSPPPTSTNMIITPSSGNAPLGAVAGKKKKRSHSS